MSLVVVHRHASIELSTLGLSEDAVRGNGTFDIKAAMAQLFNGGDNFLCLLPAEHAVLAAMGIETSHTDVRLLDTKLTAGVVDEFYALHDALLLHQVAGLSQGHMRRDVDDADILVC